MEWPLFLLNMRAFSWLESQKNVKTLSRTFTLSANHSDKPLGVLIMLYKIFGEVFSKYSNSIFTRSDINFNLSQMYLGGKISNISLEPRCRFSNSSKFRGANVALSSFKNRD